MRDKVSALQKEWRKVEKQEQLYLQKRMMKADSKLNQFLAQKVPGNLQKTLDTAFAKAFYLVFEKGTGIIEKTYKKADLEKTYQINEYAARLRNNRKSYEVFSKKANGTGNMNLLLTGISGVGLGALGVGIPDIVLFTGILLRSLYEIALNYGFDYEKEEEKIFLLLLIQGACSYGEELRFMNEELNVFMEEGDYRSKPDLKECITDAAGCLSKELLYMKFLQGIPIVGAVGGAYDVVYLKQIIKYAELKYRRRFYTVYRSKK